MVWKRRYLIKFRSYGITNVQGRGRNGLTLRKCIWVILLNSSFALFLLTIMGTCSFFFFSLSFLKKITSCPSWIQHFFLSEGAFEEILTLSEVDRHTVEILGWVVVELSGWKWTTIPGVGNCLTRHFEASNEMGTQRRKSGRWQVPFSSKLTIRQSSK